MHDITECSEKVKNCDKLQVNVYIYLQLVYTYITSSLIKLMDYFSYLLLSTSGGCLKRAKKTAESSRFFTLFSKYTGPMDDITRNL